MLEEGWNRRYEESQEARLIKMHVLTGDVMTVWRLTRNMKKGEEGGNDSNKASGSRLMYIYTCE